MEFTSPYKNDLFLRAGKKLPVPRTPVWIMRQAGRYLPEYREIRSKVDFRTLYRTPELAAEVTVQPVDIVGVDAAIFFSDILVIPEAMGMAVNFTEKNGPSFTKPLQSEMDMGVLHIPDPEKELRFVLEGIQLAKKELAGRVPLIGFAGSPWTLATYMIEGGKTQNFATIKTLLYDAPAVLHSLLDKLSIAVAEFLSAQIEAGAAAIQIFDTWGGVLGWEEFQVFSLPYIAKVINRLNRKDALIIAYFKGAGMHASAISQTGIDVIGVDWTVNLSDIRQLVKNKIAIQGNMDPCILYASPDVIRQQVRKILYQYGEGSGHIFNLGHGILPDTPVEHAVGFVKAVKEESEAINKELKSLGV